MRHPHVAVLGEGIVHVQPPETLGEPLMVGRGAGVWIVQEPDGDGQEGADRGFELEVPAAAGRAEMVGAHRVRAALRDDLPRDDPELLGLHDGADGERRPRRPPAERAVAIAAVEHGADLEPDRAAGAAARKRRHGRLPRHDSPSRASDPRTVGITSSAKAWISSRKNGAKSMKMKCVTPALT